jgi:hypothetical protein
VSSTTSTTRRGRHRAAIPRRWRPAFLAALAVVLAGATVLGLAVWRSGGVERVCGRPDDVVTRRNVTLTRDAMAAFVEAESSLEFEIDVVESYRSCREQRAACEAICGSRRGCPGLCAPPGLSWHQRAMAIDVTQEMLDTPGVIEALEAAGWCQSLPASDPGHFSFDGCH